jgi:hypothetical protein
MRKFLPFRLKSRLKLRGLLLALKERFDNLKYASMGFRAGKERKLAQEDSMKGSKARKNRTRKALGSKAVGMKQVSSILRIW